MKPKDVISMPVDKMLVEIVRIEREIRKAKDRRKQPDDLAERAMSTIKAVNLSGTDRRCNHEIVVLNRSVIDYEIKRLKEKKEAFRRNLRPCVEMMEAGPYRDAIAFRYLGGTSCAKIGKRMNCTGAYVYALLEEGRARLRDIEKSGQMQR